MVRYFWVSFLIPGLLLVFRISALLPVGYGKFMGNYREMQKETPAKLSQNGQTLQGLKKTCEIKKLNGREDWI
jgi:hypothetical protein